MNVVVVSLCSSQGRREGCVDGGRRRRRRCFEFVRLNVIASASRRADCVNSRMLSCCVIFKWISNFHRALRVGCELRHCAEIIVGANACIVQ